MTSAKNVTFKLPAPADSKPATCAPLPKTAHPRKLQKPGTEKRSEDRQRPSPAPALSGQDSGSSQRKPSPLPPGSEHRPHSRPSSEQEAAMKMQTSDPTTSRGHERASPSERRAKVQQQRLNPSGTAKLVNSMRERTHSACHDDVRVLKYNVAKLREHLLKVEEEIKHMNRGKATLEVAVQNVRRAISVNQQSVSAQQKKARLDSVSLNCGISYGFYLVCRYIAEYVHA